MDFLNQYDIVWVNLDPTRGKEIQKTRPCVILSPNEINKHLDTIIIAPMTTKSRPYPTRVPCSSGKKKGFIVLEQIRTVDRHRLGNKDGHLSEKEIQACKRVLRELLID